MKGLWRKAFAMATAGIGVAGLVGPHPARAQTSLEYSVKANYLIRFAAFVEWPPQAFSSPQAPVTICVLGRDPFGRSLVQAANAQTAFGRPLVIYNHAAGRSVAGCHMVYVGAGADVGSYATLEQPTLWVTDGTVSAQRGMIHFVVDRNRVRFHIDERAATAQRLSISSRLLALALSVEGSGR